MSLSENLYNLGALMKTNLEEKGIDGLTGNEGLTTLANKILDVEPSIAGLELSTSINCNVSSNKVFVGQQVVFSATLSASYDDTSIEDIDISGVLTGATVLFKTSDGTIIGSGVTDVNGVATYTHTIEEISNITVYSEFEGSTNFSSCISSTTVTVECNYDFDVTVDKEILSAIDNDIATFNCRLSDGTGSVSGESIDYQILYNDTVLSSGSKDTNANGEITLEYAATGVGNVDVIFSYGTLLQETYGIRDALFYDVSSNSGVSNYTTYSDATISYDSNNKAYSITENVSTDKAGYISLNNANFPNAVKLSCKMKFTNPSNAQFGLGLANGNQSVSFIPVYSSKWQAYGTYQFIQTLDGLTRTDISVSGTIPSSNDYNTIDWYTLELAIDGTDYHSKLYRENTLIGETTGTIPNNILSADRNQFVIHTGIWNYPSVLIKDIMIEPL